jgi:hypothetical protein
MNLRSKPPGPQGLKPTLISGSLRSPEGPLFQGDAHIPEFFRSTAEAVPYPKRFMKWLLDMENR